MQPTQALLRSRFRKLALTTKDVNKGYYKGTRTGMTGRHTRFGGFRPDYARVRTFVCPSLEDFRLTPFVGNTIQRKRGEFEGDVAGPRSPELYLERWKSENGLD